MLIHDIMLNLNVGITHSTYSQANLQSDWFHSIALKMTLAAMSREISEMDILILVLFDKSISGFY